MDGNRRTGDIRAIRILTVRYKAGAGRECGVAIEARLDGRAGGAAAVSALCIAIVARLTRIVFAIATHARTALVGVQTLGLAPVQVQPDSMAQTAEQPSAFLVLPSSQPSVECFTPSPQTGAGGAEGVLAHALGAPVQV